MNKLLTVLASASSLSAVTVHAQETRPNIVVFLIDDLGWNDFSCYGSKFYQTPAIDSLASEGLRFTDAYSACTVSSPTRAALMTGKYPARLHLTDWISGCNYPWAQLSVPNWTKYLPLEETTLAEYLKDAGYATWHVGKWHLGEDQKYWPENQGFDVNIAGNFKGSPNKNNKGCNGYFSPYGLERLKDGPEGEYLTDRLTNEAVNLINSSGEGPFFLNLCHYAVHTPLDAKEEMIQKYESILDKSYAQNNAVYAAMIESVDQSLRKIINALETKGVFDNTLIIITSDNGALEKISKSLSLRGGKGTEYEGGVRVPLILFWKNKISSGTVSSVPTITMDLFSTILDAAGVNVKDKKIDGVSLLPVIAGKRIPNRPLFWHYPHYHNSGATPYTSIRLGEWKLIKEYETEKYELYNLADDLGEHENVADENREILKKLSGIMDKWLIDVNAQFPLDNSAWDKSKQHKKGPSLGK